MHYIYIVVKYGICLIILIIMIINTTVKSCEVNFACILFHCRYWITSKANSD